MGVFPAWGVLFCVCSLIPVVTSAKEVTVDKRSLANERGKDAILYGYVPDKKSPNFLGRGNLIFQVNPADSDTYIKKTTDARVLRKTRYSDSENTASQQVAADMGVSGHYGAFSGSASMQVSKSSSSQIKTVRYDMVVKARQYKITSDGAFRTFPHRFLTEDFKKSVMTLTNEEIATKIGIFYATELRLGGELVKSYTMQATSQDTQHSVEAEVEAAYDGGAMGVSVTAKLGVHTRSSNSKSNMKVSWAAQGGDTTIWLGKSFVSKEEKEAQDAEIAAIAEEWAGSFNDENMFACDFKLRPMWDLIKKVNKERGDKFESYLRGVWDKAAADFRPTVFLEPERKGKIPTAWAWASNYFSSYGGHQTQREALTDNSDTTRLHTACKSDGEWIGITFDEPCYVQSVKLVNGKTDSDKYRIDDAKIWVRKDNLEIHCGTVAVSGGSTILSQTYNIECADEAGGAPGLGIYGLGVTIYSAKKTCMELGNLEAYGICGRPAPAPKDTWKQ